MRRRTPQVLLLVAALLLMVVGAALVLSRGEDDTTLATSAPTVSTRAGDDAGSTTTTAPTTTAPPPVETPATEPPPAAEPPSTTAAPPPAPPTTPPPPPTTAPPPPPPPVTRYGAAEAAYLERLNARRASVGKPPLARSGCADGVAAGWAEHLARTGVLAHNPGFADQLERCGHWRSVGENVGFGGSVEQLDRSFWASSTHQANIVGDYTHVGVAAYRADGRLWIAVDFLAL